MHGRRGSSALRAWEAEAFCAYCHATSEMIVSTVEVLLECAQSCGLPDERHVNYATGAHVTCISSIPGSPGRRSESKLCRKCAADAI